MRSESSRTTAAPASTAPSSPSSVSTLPRRNTSASRWLSSVRSTASWLPASSAATAFSSSIVRRTIAGPLPRPLGPQGLSHARGGPLAVGATARRGHHRLHHLAHVLGARGAGLADGGG